MSDPLERGWRNFWGSLPWAILILLYVAIKQNCNVYEVRKALVVARSWGGLKGKLERHGHVALVLIVEGGHQTKSYLIQAGPVSSETGQKLVGNKEEKDADEWAESFSDAKGANWSEGNKIVTVPIKIIETINVKTKLTEDDVQHAFDKVNAQVANVNYNSKGPNSNTYVRLMMVELGLPTQSVGRLAAKAGLPLAGWNWELR